MSSESDSEKEQIVAIYKPAKGIADVYMQGLQWNCNAQRQMM